MSCKSKPSRSLEKLVTKTYGFVLGKIVKGEDAVEEKDDNGVDDDDGECYYL
ncbi:hypothetical protein RchiOBHm_Chr7g0222181 [Rosa chinensis]|uniref:Uncharacterized protein n=1 Tax=Rosa chinensis TaxID=74649 RepID=A0A2P6PD78_ROSCH|nr:hypothetical protein RchiOBHm_Chr7g0222181 [Rosa chinensis]